MNDPFGMFGGLGAALGWVHGTSLAAGHDWSSLISPDWLRLTTGACKSTAKRWTRGYVVGGGVEMERILLAKESDKTKRTVEKWVDLGEAMTDSEKANVPFRQTKYLSPINVTALPLLSSFVICPLASSRPTIGTAPD